MSKTEKNSGIVFAKYAADGAAAPQAAEALLARLSALETDAPPLDDAQAQALYRRALQKAGLTDAADGAANTDGVPAIPAENGQTPVQTAPEKKKPIRWQRWALSAAAVLAVIVLGGRALVQGGFGVAMDTAEAEYQNETAMEPGAAERITEAAAEDSPAEAAVQEELLSDALPPEYAAVTDTEEHTGYSRAEDITESTAPGTAGGKVTNGGYDAKEEVSSAADGSTGTAEAPTAGGAAEETAKDAAAAERLLMVNGRLYRATALTVEPSADGGDRTVCIETVIPAGEIPSQNGQANFDAQGAPLVYWRSGVAVLLDDVWVFFEPTE